jgi:hypothetical protein
MKNKRILLITILSVCSFIILCVGLTVALALTNKEGINIEKYKPPFENYQVYNDGEYYRYYETIDGLMTCNCVDVYTEDSKVKKIEKHIKEYNETLSIDYIVLDNIDTKISDKAKELYQSTEYIIDSSSIVYYVFNYKMTPLYVVSVFPESMAKGTVICINLNTGQFVSYEEIAEINY